MGSGVGLVVVVKIRELLLAGSSLAHTAPRFALIAVLTARMRSAR